MKKTCTLLATMALCFLGNGNLHAESVHQFLSGDAAKDGGGSSAVDKKQIEVKDAPGGEKIARAVGTMPQWGYVNYWFGLPSPAGETIIRAEIFVDETEIAPYAFYVKKSSGDPLVKKIEIPSEAPKNAFYTLEIPVQMDEEWNGLQLKKIGASENPGPWIKTVSIVKP